MRMQSPVWPLLSALGIAAACAQEPIKRRRVDGAAEPVEAAAAPPDRPPADAAPPTDGPRPPDAAVAVDNRPPDTRPPDAGPPPTFTQLYMTIFGRMNDKPRNMAGCLGAMCHTTASGNSEKISFGTKAAAYDILTGRGYIDTASTDPDNSVLIDLLVQGRMPKDGPPLPVADIDRIRAWIMAGAKNN